jgi:hypothetical protein
MRTAARTPIQGAMGLAREIRRKIQWALAAQVFPLMTFARSLRTA